VEYRPSGHRTHRVFARSPCQLQDDNRLLHGEQRRPRPSGDADLAVDVFDVGLGEIASAVAAALSQAQASIVNPPTGRKVSFANMFRTHPTTAERVARLRTA
jgi:Zn-dependent protease with chaperone function